MQIKELLTSLNMCIGVAENESVISEEREIELLRHVLELSQRDWDEQVLDAIGNSYPGAGWRMTDLGEDMTPTCMVYPTVRTEDARYYTESSAPAARSAAARGEFPKLPEAEQKRLGERP